MLKSADALGRKKGRENAKILKCAGRFLELCAADPDPKAVDEYKEYFNCKECDNLSTCTKVLEAVND